MEIFLVCVEYMWIATAIDRGARGEGGGWCAVVGFPLLPKLKGGPTCPPTFSPSTTTSSHRLASLLSLSLILTFLPSTSSLIPLSPSPLTMSAATETVVAPTTAAPEVAIPAVEPTVTAAPVEESAAPAVELGKPVEESSAAVAAPEAAKVDEVSPHPPSASGGKRCESERGCC